MSLVKLITILGLLFSGMFHPVSWAAGELDVNSEISQMKTRSLKHFVGQSEKMGIYFICIEEVYIEKDMADNTACELGLAQAKKSLAGFLGSNVTSSETAQIETRITNKDGVSSAEQTELVKEFTQIDVNQFIRGVVVLRVARSKDTLEVICFSSQSVANAASEMKKTMEALPPNTVMASGIAMILDNDFASAKDNALRAALRQAVEQVMGTVIATTTQVQDSEKIKAKIFASSGGFIEKYRITEEVSIEGGYKVVVLAEVAKDKLLNDYSSLIKTMGDPSFYVRTDNKDLYLTFTKFFTDLGLRLVADPSGADYIIDAIGDYRQMKHPATGADGVQLSLWIRIFDSKSKQELLSQKNDPKKSAVFYSTGERQKDIATEKAFAEIKTPLHQEINKLIGKMAVSGRPIQVVIDNYSGAFSVELEKISEVIAMIPGSSTPNLKIDSITMQATYTLNYTGAIEAFEVFLRDGMQKNIKSKGNIPQSKDIKANRLEMSF